MAQAILILLIVAVAIVGGVFLVEAWNGQQDAQAQRLAEESRLVRARGEADAARTLASAESASIRSDASGRLLATMFPYLILASLAGLAMFVGFPILTNYLERSRAMPAQPANLLALAALGRMWLAMREQERLEVPAEMAILESRNGERRLQDE
jgi:hypothetical protein